MLKLTIQQIKDNTMSSTGFYPIRPCIKIISHYVMTNSLNALPKDTTTQHLVINTSEFGHPEAEKLASALRVNTTLTALALHWTYPTDAGAASIVDALTVNSTLISFTASQFPIPVPIAQKIAKVLEVNSTLKHLTLRQCLLEDPSAAALTRTLKINSTLVTLDLSYNKITTEGAVEIGEALSFNSTLTKLDFLSNQSIGDKGLSALIDGAKLNPSLTALFIVGTNITTVSIPKINDLIRSASSLKWLDISNNPLVSPQSVDFTRAMILDAVFSNGAITSVNTMVRLRKNIDEPDESRALDLIYSRNKHNLGQKTISLFELVQDHLIKIATEENFPIPQQEIPEKDCHNPLCDHFF